MEEKSTEALSYIKQNPSCKVSDVQKSLGVSRPVIATIIKSLEELGFVEKKQGKGRATALFVTQKGEDFLKPKQVEEAQEPQSNAAVLTVSAPNQAPPAVPSDVASTNDPAPTPSTPPSTIPQAAPEAVQKSEKKGFFAKLRALLRIQRRIAR